jgi:hypothetical protein
MQARHARLRLSGSFGAESDYAYQKQPPNLEHQELDMCSRNNPRAGLQDFPGCQMLKDAYRRFYRIPNKTPLSILYEYASRLNLEVRRISVLVRLCHGLMYKGLDYKSLAIL